MSFLPKGSECIGGGWYIQQQAAQSCLYYGIIL